VDVAQASLVYLVAAPAAVFAVFGLLWLAGWSATERALTRATVFTFATCILALLPVAWTVFRPGAPTVEVSFGNWFTVHEYRFPLVLLADRLSVPFLAMTVSLIGLIGQFSSTYLHRERGFLRFFLLLHLFAFGSLLAFAAGSFDLLVGGWEVVGITSVLLIGFFHNRAAPVENGIRVFTVYRACDIGLLLAMFALHHWAGTTLFTHGVPDLSPAQSTIVSLLLALAAAGKAAQVPFSEWLPRAMEGPTPSSAIFYGAISIHAGAYLLLRALPLMADSRVASALVIALGVITAIHGTIVGRASADAKTSLAYASLTQVGIVFVEIGIGWSTLAVCHILGHATVRTLQFLRAPSMLHDFHQMHSAVGGEFSPTGKHLEEMLPESVQMWLYRWAMDRGHLDALLERAVVTPLMRLSAALTRVDHWRSAAPKRRREDAAAPVGVSAAGGRD
jgi:NAD(P)H-quinone oxidoreductase subunit 5